MRYRVGIDVGSTTLKTVILDEKENIVEKSYQRHFSKVREATLEHIKNLETLLEGSSCQVAITGSAGLGIAKDCGLPFVQEVFSTVGAVKKRFPQTDVVIELGGEDAKIVFLQGSPEERMNGSCAGGTGAFIDQMASLMDMDAAQLDTVSLEYEKIYPIASRCGVFAKTDIQPLLNQGANSGKYLSSCCGADDYGLSTRKKDRGQCFIFRRSSFLPERLTEAFCRKFAFDRRTCNFSGVGSLFCRLGKCLLCGKHRRKFFFRGINQNSIEKGGAERGEQRRTSFSESGRVSEVSGTTSKDVHS